MSAANQEGIVMMILLIGMLIGYCRWMIRMINQWADEDERWQQHKERQRRVMEARNRNR